jgi:hypothetical protein
MYLAYVLPPQPPPHSPTAGLVPWPDSQLAAAAPSTDLPDLQFEQGKLRLACAAKLPNSIDGMLEWIGCNAAACGRVWAAWEVFMGDSDQPADMARLMAAYGPLQAAVAQRDRQQVLRVLSQHWGL